MTAVRATPRTVQNAGHDIASFARPVLLNSHDRPGRLRESMLQVSCAAGRPLSVDNDVHVIRPLSSDGPDGFASHGFCRNLDAHLRAARWARSRQLSRVLIMEDDLLFAREWAVHGPGLLAELERREWDIASLGYRNTWREAPEPDALSGHGRVGSGWVRFSGRVDGAHAYFVNHSAFDRWIRHLETVACSMPGNGLWGPPAPEGALNTFAWVDPRVVRLIAVPNMVGTRPTHPHSSSGPLDRLPLVGGVVEQIRRRRGSMGGGVR